MIHDLTAGHMDATGAVLRPLDMRIVGRLLDELGRTDDEGSPTLDGWKVRVENGCVILPWKGGRTNRGPRNLPCASSARRAVRSPTASMAG